MSGADLILLGILLAAVILALRAVRRGKTGSCSGDCAHCRKDCHFPGKPGDWNPFKTGPLSCFDSANGALDP